MSEAVELYDLYCEWRTRTHGWQREMAKHPMRSGRVSAERLKPIEQMIAWCRDRQLDPWRWLYSMFAAKRWLYAPSWEQLTPSAQKTEKEVRRSLTWQVYHHEGPTPVWSEYLRRRERARQQEAGVVFDPNRDLHPTSERIKLRYAECGQSQRCLDEMTTQTFGYHPQSEVCRNCPLRFTCADRLHPAVMQLRHGQITAEQAKLIAGLGHATR